MREELLRVLNYKLDDIKGDIEALENLNSKIDEEKEKSSFIENILNTFKENGSNNIMNLVKVDRNDFERALDIAGEETKDKFSTGSCNYDGLVYLINGINSGVSLALTDDQKESIEGLIESLSDKKKEFDSAVDGYTLVKSRYEINDVEVLEGKKTDYEKIISGIDKKDYIKDTDLVTDAIEFSTLSPEQSIKLLSYVLEYNADVYKEGKYVDEEVPVEPETEEEKTEEPEETEVKEEKDEYSINTPDESDEDTFHFNQIDDSNLFEMPNITFDEEKKEEKEEDYDIPTEEESTEESYDVPTEEESVEESYDIPSEEESTEENDNYVPEYQEYTPYTEGDEEVSIPNELTYVPEVEESSEESKVEDNVSLEPNVDESKEESYDIPTEIEESKDEPVEIDNEFNDVIDTKEDYDDRETQEEEKISTRELQKIFGKYGIEENTILNELIDGNVNDYQNILDSLRDNGVLEYYKNNRELLVETLLYSNVDVVDKILKIVKEDLSVDDEDFGITIKIVINTIPSVFVKDGGNYDNFVKNIELFKEQEINLINLFDFSKEVFVADHELILKNLDIINKYGFDITYKNAKYFLLIPNVADRIDYYIESVYNDKEKNETFDGINYIKDYTAKLNVVTDETIKRLRYASENGKKVFGSKPGSLSGEITNLKVNALDISDEYMNKFFNNEFASLTGDEVREYVKLIHNSSNVGDYSDELDKLNKYKDGLRYNIEGVNVSYNKVVRNYSILRSYGMDTKKALQFAVCYNLIITKDEYDKLNNLLVDIGGNI